MKLKNIFKAVALSLGLTCFPSCDYLNVSDELASELSVSEVFENAGYTRRFHRGIYSRIPDMSLLCLNESYSGVDGLGNPWPAVCDELKCAHNNVKTVPIQGENASNASLGRWGLYQNIRQANIFLERAHPISSEKEQLDAVELKSMKAEARFLRAYYHYLLFELYGPIVIMDESTDPSSATLDFYRNSVDEVVEFVDKELLEAAKDLKESEPKERRAVPTKGTALAVRAKLWVYAASPLYNGGYKEGMAMVDAEGKQLFPAYDAGKWKKALNALQDFITYSESHYKLYKAYTDGKYDADKSLYELFQYYNDEIIWASTKDSWGSVEYEGTQRRCTPRNVRATVGFSSIGVVQELVDAFFCKDGLSIQESPLYSEKGFTKLTHEVQVLNETKEFTDYIFNMYMNREPRFYQCVTYPSKRWHIGGEEFQPWKGGADDNSSDNQCYTGYLLYKGINRTLYAYGSYPRNWFRPNIIFRLADFYLLYAEALNEVNPADSRVIEYIDRVRERAGIPLLKDIKPEIIGNKELQRQAIVHERRVELCIEGQRYFDIRRWMTAEKSPAEGGQKGAFHGMNMNATGADFFKRVPFEDRVFSGYLYAIPFNEIQKSTKLVQNPGW